MLMFCHHIQGVSERKQSLKHYNFAKVSDRVTRFSSNVHEVIKNTKQDIV